MSSDPDQNQHFGEGTLGSMVSGKTPGVSNVEKAFSRGGGSSTHTPGSAAAAAAARGSSQSAGGAAQDKGGDQKQEVSYSPRS